MIPQRKQISLKQQLQKQLHHTSYFSILEHDGGLNHVSAAHGAGQLACGIVALQAVVVELVPTFGDKESPALDQAFKADGAIILSGAAVRDAPLVGRV